MDKTTHYKNFRTHNRVEKLKNVILKRQPSLTVVFENVHDPHNVSAVIRSCDAVGVLDVHFVYHSGQVFPKLGAKSSASARKWVNIHKYQDIDSCYGILRNEGKKIYTTNMSADSVSLYDLDMTKPIALVFGNEHEGVTQKATELADGNFLIPQVGVIQSLNISVAAAVSLFEAYRQRFNAGMYDNPIIDENEIEIMLDDWLKR